jgi:maltose phosphorylase
MEKTAQKYLETKPWSIVERGFHKERSLVSESLFSSSNEYAGVRGYFEEGISLPSLRGSYFNGIYDYAKEDTPNAYLGIVKRTHFMVNAMDYFKITLVANGTKLDLASSEISDFVRKMDFKTGELTRCFVWRLDGNEIKLSFSRFLSMTECHRAYQKIEIESKDSSEVAIVFCLDGNMIQWGRDVYFTNIRKEHGNETAATFSQTLSTEEKVASFMTVEAPIKGTFEELPLGVSLSYKFKTKVGEKVSFRRTIVNLAERNGASISDFSLSEKGNKELKIAAKDGYEKALDANKRYWGDIWKKSDIAINGDKEDQQGIRFAIFQLEQTYHGFDSRDNIGAKGLTGEAYSGHAFWDSETYCLPYYLFNNPSAAKDMLMFRYFGLEEAKKRALMLDCHGACYPIATLNGKEGCNLWQHASLQFQPSSGVVYGIYHYEKVTGDNDFILDYGLEMVLEIARFLLERGQWNAARSHFGFYGVMGPDEFKMMVNHNTYTNYMAKRTFQYARELLEKYEKDPRINRVLAKIEMSKKELKKMREAEEKMLILYNPKTELFEENEGFYGLPHIDIDKIPATEFPLYSHWSYDRIYRGDMIKQPDVLMFMFLHSAAFTKGQKLANYDFYEPRCIHESSLSPSIHSIFACELGKTKEALSFFAFATRMDLDDYNRNAGEGLHMTSIAAAWMNIVYGFGGLRSDGDLISINPQLPAVWKSYSFHVLYHGSRLKISVDKMGFSIANQTHKPVVLLVAGKKEKIVRSISFEKGNE